MDYFISYYYFIQGNLFMRSRNLFPASLLVLLSRVKMLKHIDSILEEIELCITSPTCLIVLFLEPTVSD